MSARTVRTVPASRTSSSRRVTTRASTPQRKFHGDSIGAREKAVRSKVALRIISILVLAGVLSIIQIWSRTEILNLRYKITEVQRRADTLIKEIQRAETVVTAMQSADRLIRIGTEKLGMSPPASGQVVFVRKGEGVVQP